MLERNDYSIFCIEVLIGPAVGEEKSCDHLTVIRVDPKKGFPAKYLATINLFVGVRVHHVFHSFSSSNKKKKQYCTHNH